MIEIQRQNWFKDPERPERQSKFIAGVRRACQEGKYDKNHQMFAMLLRREDPEFRRKQKEAAKLSQLENSRMSNPDTYQKMVNSKREQFSGYDNQFLFQKAS